MGWFYFFAWDAVCTVWRDRRSLILAVLFIAAAVGLLAAVGTGIDPVPWGEP